MSTDPRRIRGGIVGPGGPHDHGAVILDARNAILLESVDVAAVDPDIGGRGQSDLALALGGRINQTKDKASVLFIFGTDGAAAIITQLIALIGRAAGPQFVAEFMADTQARLDQLRDDGHLT